MARAAPTSTSPTEHVQVQISGDEIKARAVIKGNHQPEGELPPSSWSRLSWASTRTAIPSTPQSFREKIKATPKTGIMAPEPDPTVRRHHHRHP